MLAMVRIFVPRTENEKDLSDSNKQIWDYVMQNCQDWSSGNVKILYLTQQINNDETSLFLSLNDVNDFDIFKNKCLSTIENVDRISLLEFIDPKFFSIPKGTPIEYKRFSLSISADPPELKNIYETISNFKPKDNVIVSYVTVTSQESVKEILVSIVTNDTDSAVLFSENFIKPMVGVKYVTVRHVNKTKRIASYSEWKDHIKLYSTASNNDQELSDKKDTDITPWEYNEKFVCC